MTKKALRAGGAALLLLGIFLLFQGGPLWRGEVLAIMGGLMVGGSFAKPR